MSTNLENNFNKKGYIITKTKEDSALSYLQENIKFYFIFR